MTPSTTYWRERAQTKPALYELVEADADLVILRDAVTEDEHIISTQDFAGRFTVVHPTQDLA